MTELNPRSIVGRNPVAYRCLTPDPAQALLFGNGAMGGSVHTPDDSLYVLISRADIWNAQGNQGSIAAVRVRGRPGLFNQARHVEQVCDLYAAHIRIRVDDTTFTLTCLRGQDLLILDIENPCGLPTELSATIANWHAGDETTATETIHVNCASAFAESNARVKVDAAKLGLPDPLLGRAWGLFVRSERQSPSRQQVRIAAVCRPPNCGIEAVRAAGRALVSAPDRDVDAWLAQHRRWWAEFWSRSCLALESGTGDAEYEERVWYANLYYLACAHGGAYPARFNGAIFLLDKDTRGWDGGYWFQNMRELYWPLLATGHWDWMRDFFQMYFDALPFVRAQTKAIFGIDAPSFRETQTFWGCSPDTDLIKPHFNQGVHHNFSNNLEVCLLMDWYCRASGNEAFRREKLYPFLKEILAFYRQYAQRGADGRWHIAPANAIEVWPDARDPMPDIAGLHYLLPRFIAWGEQFGEDAGTLARWREFLEKLPPIPVGYWTILQEGSDHGIHRVEWHVASRLDPTGLFLPAADKTLDRMQRRNMENAELYVVFPWGLIGMDSPPAERRRFECTWHHRTWKLVNNGWAQDVPQLARMGWAELAKQTSLEHASYGQRFPNGAFICADSPHFHGLLTPTPYLDAAGVHITGLNEMLLQSYDDIVRIAPSVSAEWSGAFKLHTLGGLTVEAAFTHGQPTRARLTAARETTLRMRNYRPEAMQVAGREIATGMLFEKPMRQGEVLEVRWAGVVPQTLSVEPRPAVVYPGYKIRPPRAAHPTGHWHDERKGHGQIGLAEDGRFPATMTPH